MTQQLKRLIKAARGYVMTDVEREEQARSFAYGNTRMENPLITREMIDEEADKSMRRKSDGGGVAGG